MIDEEKTEDDDEGEEGREGENQLSLIAQNLAHFGFKPSTVQKLQKTGNYRLDKNKKLAIIDAVIAGKAITTAAKENRTGFGTVCFNLLTDKDFFQAIEFARFCKIIQIESELLEIADSANSKNAHVAKLRIETRMKILEKYHKNWSKMSENNFQPNVNIKSEGNVYIDKPAPLSQSEWLAEYRNRNK